MRKKKIEDYTREECVSLALYYGKLETFRRKAYNAYAAAHIFGWWDDIKKLIGQRHSMTKEECHEIALRYLTPKEWERNDARTYGYAKNHGWIPDITTHMKRIVDYTLLRLLTLDHGGPKFAWIHFVSVPPDVFRRSASSFSKSYSCRRLKSLNAF